MKKHFRDRPSTTGVKPEQILEGHTPQIRALAERLRRIILETVPDAVEAAYPVWRGIGYPILKAATSAESSRRKIVSSSALNMASSFPIRTASFGGAASR